ncbi:hypothetical protein GCM10007173_20560 [Glutamicibacter ardleyensis]|uniref:Uncharacterized protein n=1 Tax=Glutamicibacter ardleyensis TaxID=225894 RepID=A0ABQ2DPS6_9MICC|nr:hypothetical protein GCM10007173_20560 [Glutamicibacter ardleyensis]
MNGYLANDDIRYNMGVTIARNVCELPGIVQAAGQQWATNRVSFWWKVW